MEIIEKLKQLNIPYELIEHPAVYTVKEAKSIVRNIEGVECKNLFLESKKQELFLYTVPQDKKVNLKELAQILGVTRLHFAPPEVLEEVLGVIPGSVTPLGIINDTKNRVTILLDKKLKNKKVLVHPNRNTATISIEYKDLIKVIDNLNHKHLEIKIEN